MFLPCPCLTTISFHTSYHADNCHVVFSDSRDGHAVCDPTRSHPYATRVAASILFLNSGTEEQSDNSDDDDSLSSSFQGGEFYWADPTTGEPAVTVTPHAGRMVYFTAGPENLHGALPVRRHRARDTAKNYHHPDRRLTLAMWYVLAGDPNQEQLPTTTVVQPYDDPDQLHVLFVLPVQAVKPGGLRMALMLYLLGQQNTPTPGSWVAHTDDGNHHRHTTGNGVVVVRMIFPKATNTIMFNIRIGSTAITVDRFVEPGATASLPYLLQESVQLHGVLDELQALAFDDNNIREEDRLLQLDEKVVIEQARAALPARRA
mmetsp:Transcript_5140/g.10148  ORF Transcript_5140/g.10148 Transcript_5140/m.10148 type:complete len:317 (-) Transcript_5140:236-1186(-)|eukprot:scaffold606_cov180-Amphora_coffeaeformis.AAC.5